MCKSQVVSFQAFIPDVSSFRADPQLNSNLCVWSTVLGRQLNHLNSSETDKTFDQQACISVLNDTLGLFWSRRDA